MEARRVKESSLDEAHDLCGGDGINAHRIHAHGIAPSDARTSISSRGSEANDV